MTHAIGGDERSSARARAQHARRVAGTALLLVAAALWFSPLMALILTAIKTPTDFGQHGALAIPHSFTLQNFIDGWNIGQFGTAFQNSGLITLVKVPIGVVLAALLSFSLAKLKLPLRRVITFTMLMGLTIPIFIAVVPIFTMLRSVGLTNSLWGLLPPYLAFGLPFETLVLTSFFGSVPDE
ncbi:MAG: hypothetical protein M0Z51_08025, partial [Propionibacterium sp.]|nr:hypothetical protein [Propionibacterium sp.]